MTILEELIIYAENCIGDVKISQYEDYISCVAHKNACRRFLSDLDRIGNKDFPYDWNEDQAQSIVDWFSYLNHSKGILARKPIMLTLHQKFDLCQIYGWVNINTGYRRFKKYFKEEARKNAKSQEEAGVNLYEISVTSTKNGEVNEAYTAGVKRQQSEIIFNEARLMLRGSPLQSKFKVTKKMIYHRKSESYIRPLSKDDGENGDGSNPAILTLDEYHEHLNTDFYDLALGSNTKESLLMIITTAGKNLNSPCYTQEYQYVKRLLDPNSDVENDEYFGDIFEIDEKDDISDERNWIKANPVRMSYADGVSKIRGEYKLAKEIPEKMTAFLTKCLDRWVQAKANGYMNMAKWKKCEVKELTIDTTGMDVYVGFDMSAKIDLTSIAFIIPYRTDQMDASGKPIVKYILYSHSFVPSMEKLMEHKRIDKVAYDAWERQGFITITESEIVDQSVVMKYVMEKIKKHNWKIQCLCFDPANAGKLMMDLSNEGYDVEEVFQSHKSLNESTAGFREQVYCQNVIYEKNPVLNYAMGNAIIKTSNGLIKIDKDAAGGYGQKRIDPVDATLCAFKLALYHKFENSVLAGIDRFLQEEW